MVNFVYLVGDRETGEAVIIDPAYDIDELLGVLPPTACAASGRWPPTSTPITWAAT